MHYIYNVREIIFVFDFFFFLIDEYIKLYLNWPNKLSRQVYFTLLSLKVQYKLFSSRISSVKNY